ncbi:MAG TPA: M36 family metallopeptidase, partial [Saprospiraceae bacterium]|nr:M36 family metallopeptidase [Saprospiraceae bacterium]
MMRLLFVFLFVFSLICLRAQTNLPDLNILLDQHKNELGLTAEDITEYNISSAYKTDHLHVTHVYLEQRYKDIPVYAGILNLNLVNDQVVSFGNRWITDLKSKAPSLTPKINAHDAVARAAAHLGFNNIIPKEISKEKNKEGQFAMFKFEPTGISFDTISASLAWLTSEQKNVFLCWKVTIAQRTSEDVWIILIDALTGAFIKKDNLTQHCSFPMPNGNFAKQEDIQPINLSPAPPMMVVQDSSYNVFAMPVESPSHGSRTIQTRPWLNAGAGNNAVTLGWHSNGTTNYTSTRGNNVYAYDDINNDNAPGVVPDTFNLRFDYPYYVSTNAQLNLKACITDLFYWNNLMHDVTYQYGFTEPAGNFQSNNLNRGGAGGDDVQAEAQDGGGTNNANFSTPADGSKPRMQMYLWSSASTYPLRINSPTSIDGQLLSVESNFSTNNKLINVGAKTGDLVLVNDTGGSTHLGCGVMSNAGSLPGKIAVIDRGTCDFVTKVKNVQNNGAIAAIVIDNVPGEAPFAMSGSDNSITIPAVMIGYSDGVNLKAVLANNTVNATESAVVTFVPDGDFDSGVICHEYGHGVSSRLTGGPGAPYCLGNAEQMGEGWSDFFALMLTTDWTTATSAQSRGIGTYVKGQAPSGVGIRTYPYAIDMTVNPFTYADVANSSGSVHYIGSIWATMLWEMVWGIIAVNPPSADIYHGTGGNNVALQLVIDGMKLQPCTPGFVDGRDAILLADKLYYGGQYQCVIWNAFAKRGLGKSASQGNTNSYTDGVVAYDIPDDLTIRTTPNPAIAGEGQETTFTLKAKCECVGKNAVTVQDVLSNNLTYIPGSGGSLTGNTVSFVVDTLAPKDSVQFAYKAYVNPCSPIATSTLNTENVEGALQYTSFKLSGPSGPATPKWSTVTTESVSPTHSWNAPDYTTSTDYVLKLNNNVTTATGWVEIGFYHRYNTEVSWDGGIVEYSINNGTTWIDAGPYFTENGYTYRIASNSGTALAGKKAFTGSSDSQFNTTGFIHSTIRLVLSPNQSFLIRFRMATDGSVGVSGINGWFVDDIIIKQISGLTNKSKVIDNNQTIDSLTYALQTSVFTGNKIYVDANANGTKSGDSWVNAMRYLPNAIAIAGCRTADSVLVAKGTYYPSLNNTRTQSFTIPNNTSVFGGFPTGGGTFAQRNFVTNESLLSGDIGT